MGKVGKRFEKKEKRSTERLVDGKKPLCSETQPNSIRRLDFTCRMESGSHNVHIDRATGLRWGHPEHPRGIRRNAKAR